MEINTIQRPSLLPAAAWAPPATSAVNAAAQSAPAPRVHQAQAQAELAQVLVTTDGGYGITGFVGGNGLSVDKKRMTDASGAPPRGRPV